jgi:phenylacetate-CoA ligase
VIHDKDFRDWGRAGRLYSQHLCGFPIGNAFFMLWGSMRDINDAKDSTTKRILNALLQVHPLNAFLMDDERMSAYAKEIHDSSINHLMAYVDAAYQLARHVERRGLQMRPIKSIMACAGTVTEDFRSTLARVFSARVHNKYGSRECADMACECACGGFHIYHTGAHIEIVDEHGKPVPAGVTGRILVTLLLNRRFPLIRYEIGDIGALSAATCQCGSPLPLLDRVEGRITEVITSAAGTYVSPLYFCHLVGVVHNPGAIERFQFTQSGAAEYSLALQLEEGFSDAAFASLTAKLLSDFSKVLGSQAKISFQRVADIPPSASGKRLYVRNLYRKP